LLVVFIIIIKIEIFTLYLFHYIFNLMLFRLSMGKASPQTFRVRGTLILPIKSLCPIYHRMLPRMIEMFACYALSYVWSANRVVSKLLTTITTVQCVLLVGTVQVLAVSVQSVKPLFIRKIIPPFRKEQ